MDARLSLCHRHLERYLLTFAPTARVEFYTTKRYTEVTGHTELAAYATRPLATNTILSELQGSTTKLPKRWINEAEGHAAGSDHDDDDDEEDTGSAQGDEGDEGNVEAPNGGTSADRPLSIARQDKRDQQARRGRRSDRIKRRDFSVVCSSRYGVQLLLGPARFLNVSLVEWCGPDCQHDCEPNVVFHGAEKHVTFKVTRPIKIGEELLTY